MSRPGPEFEYGASLSCHIVAATETAVPSQAVPVLVSWIVVVAVPIVTLNQPAGELGMSRIHPCIDAPDHDVPTARRVGPGSPSRPGILVRVSRRSVRRRQRLSLGPARRELHVQPARVVERPEIRIYRIRRLPQVIWLRIDDSGILLEGGGIPALRAHRSPQDHEGILVTPPAERESVGPANRLRIRACLELDDDLARHDLLRAARNTQPPQRKVGGGRSGRGLDGVVGTRGETGDGGNERESAQVWHDLSLRRSDWESCGEATREL